MEMMEMVGRVESVVRMSIRQIQMETASTIPMISVQTVHLEYL